ncbi:thioredoxin family protein [Clostridium senegalense]|uniref:thioredoxin family protein n=1 Tax=Clostridium senegalense TaxID=1465809 RepID=UPI000289A82A|nr:thioredoxin family protein [Clostridium senegalense]
MKILNDVLDIERCVRENNFVILYFSNESCEVCNVLKGKVDKIVDYYEELKSFKIEINDCKEVVSKYNIFDIPTVVFYIDGKEILRERRYINLSELDKKINRYYNLYNR